MEPPRPRLVSLEPNEAPGAGPEPAPEPAPPRRRTSLVLALLLVVALSGLLAQSWRASRLEAQVGELETRLGTAQAEIEARDAHLGRVREAVTDLGREVTALEALVEQEP